jgi:alkanesulfonate monooxygenase SsuD/methylene tetrahydromethanopterin reductase-like flavin-dependent oxidoreductase (luciferase family)
MLAGLSTGLQLGTLVSPVSMRAPGLVAKAVATLDVLSGGRAFCGLGAGWWAREHAAYGLTLPPARERLDRLAAGVETLRALWAPGTGPHAGRYVALPETTCYPRPTGPVPVIVGGAGERTLRIAAELADGANVPADGRLPQRIDVLRRACSAAGRDPAEVEVTVLDVAVVGKDRDDAAARVERLRGRTRAATFAARHHAGTPAQHARRYRELAGVGVGTVFLAVPDLWDAEDLERCAPLLAALR